MKRHLWKRTHPTSHVTPWPCSECGKGLLTLIPKSLVHKETVPSQRAHNADGWDPDWIEYTYSAWLKCTSGGCGQEYALSGIGGVEPCYDEDGSTNWRSYFAPKWLSPMPDIFEIPPKCPEEVKNQLRASFRLFWADRAASASKVRIALECLMDHLGVQKRQKDNGGRLTNLTLHKRIEIFQRGNPTIGLQLMAIKWVGNTGSHESQIALDDLLDAFEILEHALSELIDQRSVMVAKLAKQLTKKHTRKRRK